MSTVGGRIQAARLAKGLTQQQVADLVGVSKGAISQWESGKIEDLKADNILKLADVLEVSARWIWHYKDASGKVIPMGRPTRLDPDESALIETFKLLEPRMQDAILDKANEYLRLSASQQKPSRANPYPKPLKSKK